MDDPWLALLTGRVVGGYTLTKPIGRGNFGLVFEARSAVTDSSFAMKVLPPQQQSGSEIDFDNEGVLLKRLNRCSSVINFVDTGVQSVELTVGAGGPQVPVPLRYHVLALASGNLEELIEDSALLAQLSWPERLRLWRGAIKGVHQMHLNDVAHRDLKASNCLLVVSGSTTELRVADLGRAKDMTKAATLPPEAYLTGRGDRRFAPPEYLWLQGRPAATDFKCADLYGLGSLLVELATGHPMTAQAIGSWQTAVVDGQRHLLAGTVRDLGTLRPQYRRAINDIADLLPAAIRHDGAQLISQLCDPVPELRLPRNAPWRRNAPDGGLAWLLRRADILCRRLSVEKRRSSRYTKSSRSA